MCGLFLWVGRVTAGAADWVGLYNYGLAIVNLIDVEAGVRHPA